MVRAISKIKCQLRKERGFSMSFSVLPLLLGNKQISVEVRRALVEKRLQDAAQGLMQEHGLSCLEASHLLDVSVCDQ
jgi:hypothetical protein